MFREKEEAADGQGRCVVDIICFDIRGILTGEGRMGTRRDMYQEKYLSKSMAAINDQWKGEY